MDSMLDRLGIRYELRSYDVDPDDLAAETIAQEIGMSPEHVFKTLVARGDKHGVCLAVVPGNMSSASVSQSADSYPFPGSAATISTNSSGGNAIMKAARNLCHSGQPPLPF